MPYKIGTTVWMKLMHNYTVKEIYFDSISFLHI